MFMPQVELCKARLNNENHWYCSMMTDGKYECMWNHKVNFMVKLDHHLRCLLLSWRGIKRDFKSSNGPESLLVCLLLACWNSKDVPSHLKPSIFWLQFNDECYLLYPWCLESFESKKMLNLSVFRYAVFLSAFIPFLGIW